MRYNFYYKQTLKRKEICKRASTKRTDSWWLESSVTQDRKIDKGGTVRRLPGAGHRSFCSIENIQQVETLVLSQKGTAADSWNTKTEIARELISLNRR